MPETVALAEAIRTGALQAAVRSGICAARRLAPSRGGPDFCRP